MNSAAKIGEANRLQRVMEASDAAEQFQNDHRAGGDWDEWIRLAEILAAANGTTH